MLRSIQMGMEIALRQACAGSVPKIQALSERWQLAAEPIASCRLLCLVKGGLCCRGLLSRGPELQVSS